MNKKLTFLFFSLVMALTFDAAIANPTPSKPRPQKHSKKVALKTKTTKTKSRSPTTKVKKIKAKNKKLLTRKTKNVKIKASKLNSASVKKPVVQRKVKPNVIATNCPKNCHSTKKYNWQQKWGFTPYMGVNVESRHFDFQKGFGDNLFRHDYPQGNVYLGARIKNIGIELGYQATIKRARINTLNSGDIAAGLIVPVSSIQYQSTGEIKGLHANVVVFIPFWEEYGFDFIGMIGAARLKANFIRTSIGLNGGPLPPNVTTNSIFSKRKNVLHLGIGLQHMFIENWGVRTMIKWENTNKFNTINDVLDNDTRIANKNNSVIYSFGTFVTF